MRYSSVVGNEFYRIGLAPMMQELLDIHFAGASHHLFRYRQAIDDAPELIDFHLKRHRAHLRHLMNIVYRFGDFTFAQDQSERDLDERESWNPEKVAIPDPDMFNMMLPDSRFYLGSVHMYDEFLKDLVPPIIAPEIIKRALPRLRLVANS